MVYKRHLLLLANKYWVMAPDLPGFGKSEIPDKIWGLIDDADYTALP